MLEPLKLIRQVISRRWLRTPAYIVSLKRDKTKIKGPRIVRGGTLWEGRYMGI
jgi:hypothetical protein